MHHPHEHRDDTRNNDGDTEWEYELHPTQKETYYLTLDTSTLNPPTPPKAGRPPASKPRKSITKPISSSSGNATTEPAHSSTTGQPTTPSEPKDSVQILDLHSPNPLVRYKETLYSCTWTTDHGSSIYVSRSGEVPGPLRKGRAVDVVGLSRVRLLGREAKVKLKPRRDLELRRGGATAKNAGVVATQASQIGSGEQSVDIVAGEERHASDRELEQGGESTTMLEGDRKRRRRDFLNAFGLPLDSSVARERYTPRQPPVPPESGSRHNGDDAGADALIMTDNSTQGTGPHAARAEMFTAHADSAQAISERTVNSKDDGVAHAAEGFNTPGAGSLQPEVNTAVAESAPAKKRRKPGPKSAAQIRAEVGLRR